MSAIPAAAILTSEGGSQAIMQSIIGVIIVLGICGIIILFGVKFFIEIIKEIIKKVKSRKDANVSQGEVTA